jgi:hypothetical protein
MTTTQNPPSTTHATNPTSRRRSTGRTVTLVAGGLLALFSVTMLAAGGAALATAGHHDGDGFITGESGRFSTDTYAISTPSVDIDATGPDAAYIEDLIGKLRIQVRPTQPDTSLFIGIGRAADVAGYLDQVSHDRVENLDSGPFRTDYDRHPGGQPATDPAAQTFWVASDSGTGPRTLTWSMTGGDWTMVVMNTDASTGIEADVTAGVTLPILRPVAITMLVVGGVLLPVALVLIVAPIAIRRRSRAVRPVN